MPFVNFKVIPLGDIDMIDSFFRTTFLLFEINNQEISSRTKPNMFSATFLPRTNTCSRLAFVAMLT